MSEIQIGETVSDEQIANAAYASGVAAEKKRVSLAVHGRRRAVASKALSVVQLENAAIFEDIEACRL